MIRRVLLALCWLTLYCEAWTCQQNSNNPNCGRPPPVYAHGDVASMSGTKSPYYRSRRTLRSRVVEFCARGWLRDARRRGTLRIGVLGEVKAVEAESCSSRMGCPDVVRVSAREVSWGKREDLLKLSWIDAEIVNLHSRVLSKGKHGSMRATVALSAADLDASALWRKQLGTLLKRMLEKYLREPVYDLVLSTEIKDRSIGVTGSYSSAGDASRATFRLETSLQPTRHGAIALHSVKLELPVRSVVAEAIGELYLSTVDLESPFDVTHIDYQRDRLVATLVTGDHYVSPAYYPSTPPRTAAATKTAESRRLGRFFANDDDDDDDARSAPLGRRDRGANARGGGDGATRIPLTPHPPPPVAALPWPFVFFDLPRTTFVLGDKLPWVFNAKNAAPRVVVIAFACVAALLHVSAVPDHIFAIANTPISTVKEGVVRLAPVILNAFFKFTALSQSFLSALFVAVVPNSVLRPVQNAANGFLKLCTQVKNLLLPPPHARQNKKKKKHARWNSPRSTNHHRRAHQQNAKKKDAAGTAASPQDVVLLVVNDRANLRNAAFSSRASA